MGNGVLGLKGHRDQGARLCRTGAGEAARWRCASAEPALCVTGCRRDVQLGDTDGCTKGWTDRC